MEQENINANPLYDIANDNDNDNDNANDNANDNDNDNANDNDVVPDEGEGEGGSGNNLSVVVRQLETDFDREFPERYFQPQIVTSDDNDNDTDRLLAEERIINNYQVITQLINGEYNNMDLSNLIDSIINNIREYNNITQTNNDDQSVILDIINNITNFNNYINNDNDIVNNIINNIINNVNSGILFDIQT